MGAAAKRIWQPGEYEAACIAHAVSSDETREILNKPFGQVFKANGKGYICGTDGHRMAIVQSDEWARYARTNAPPAEHVLPLQAKWLGEISAAAFEDLDCFPKSWTVNLQISPLGAELRVSVEKGSGKSRKTLRPFGFNRVPVACMKLEQLTFDFGINLPYLLDAVEFIGTGSVHVWGTESLAPLAFTASSKPILEAQRVAVVMPVRL